MRDAYPFGLAAAVVAFGVAIAYPVLISRQGSLNDWGRVVLIDALILIAGVLATAGSLVTGKQRATMLWPATAILLVLGFLGMFSIGLPLFIAGVLTGIGAARAMRGRPRSQPRARRPRSASSRP